MVPDGSLAIIWMPATPKATVMATAIEWENILIQGFQRGGANWANVEMARRRFSRAATEPPIIAMIRVRCCVKSEAPVMPKPNGRKILSRIGMAIKRATAAIRSAFSIREKALPADETPADCRAGFGEVDRLAVIAGEIRLAIRSRGQRRPPG